MKPMTAVPFCAAVLTVVALTVLEKIKILPIWPVFIAWACFFHLGGGDKDPQAAIKSLLMGLLFGVVMGWLSALAILANPFAGLLPGWFSGALIAAIAVGVIVALALAKPLLITPVCIYGYASTWGFLDVAGRFDLGTLTSFSPANVVIALPAAFILGCVFAYINARLVDQLIARQDVAGLGSLRGVEEKNR